VLGETVEVLLEGQGFERTSEDRGADRQVAVLQSTDRGARNEDTRRHLGLAHAAAAASRAKTRPKGLSSPLGVRMKGLLGSAHVI